MRRSLGVVLQEVNLFTGTVMENLRYGNPNATDEDCIAAAKLANADGFIRMLPKGYNTVLKGDGSGLSQGQRQLISIARAAVSNPPVMILDEATSNIDAESEEIIMRLVQQLSAEKLILLISHRLANVMPSKRIFVMENGSIRTAGTHEELMQTENLYSTLFRQQKYFEAYSKGGVPQ